MFDFLRGTNWENAQASPVAGDLSARRYFRLSKNGETAILMDAEPDSDSVARFRYISRFLRNHRLSVPEIYLSSETRLLLEDLGDTKFSALAEATQLSGYETIIDLLVYLRGLKPPNLHQPDAKELVDLTNLTDENYPISGSLNPFRNVLKAELARLNQSPKLSLRDFHADNLMWLPDRRGIKKIGILDFQDAFLVHPIYDLVSLITDARRDISDEIKSHLLARYYKQTGEDPVQADHAFAVFSAQRNLRILGIFAQSARNGKPQHLGKLPRVWAYFKAALNHPAFAAVRDQTIAALPFPDDSIQGAIK